MGGINLFAFKMLLGMLSSGFGLIGAALFFIALNRFWDKRNSISDSELVKVKKDLKLGAVLFLIYLTMVSILFF